MLTINTVREVAQKTGKTERTVQRMIRAGEVFPTLEVRVGRRVQLGVEENILSAYLSRTTTNKTK